MLRDSRLPIRPLANLDVFSIRFLAVVPFVIWMTKGSGRF